MNIQECDILNELAEEPFTNQRLLSKNTRHSLGIINRSLKGLMNEGYLDETCGLTEKARELLDESTARRAVILAAGFGMRMVPINTETPKGLLEVHGEPLIERTIKQLHEAGIYEIYIVVGFMKEQYEYLIDQYDVRLIVNAEYSVKNNLHSVKLAGKYLENAYIVPCDIWCRRNPFRKHELYSWYMVSDQLKPNSSVRVNRKMELVSVPDSEDGNEAIGICYLTGKDGPAVAKRIEKLAEDPRYDNVFWEEALYGKDRMTVPARVVPAGDAVEINTYEQLRELDSNSNQLKSDAIETAASALQCSIDEIVNITILKKGMTNRSFLFDCRDKKYIMRIPGEGTDRLIDRKREAQVYDVIKSRRICDDIVYINPENGYKITEFLNRARVCDPLDMEDVEKCMGKLREFHGMGLRVDHRFDLFGQMEFYESLWEGKSSAYKDYKDTKDKVLSLKEYIDGQEKIETLTHIDAVPDNFLFAADQNGEEEIRLIDWEYAGMQDPHVDLAMFSIYSFYSREQIDRLIDIYFQGDCPEEIRTKIYCYVSVCGLLWSNWCEYKRNLGVDFGEYSLRQYRYAKEFYKIASSRM